MVPEWWWRRGEIAEWWCVIKRYFSEDIEVVVEVALIDCHIWDPHQRYIGDVGDIDLQLEACCIGIEDRQRERFLDQKVIAWDSASSTSVTLQSVCDEGRKREGSGKIDGELERCAWDMKGGE